MEQQEQEEESGWTAYFEDFSNQQHHQQQQYSSCSNLIASSTVSDAASCAAWRFPDPSRAKFPKKLRFKKTRTKEISQDDSLEDTASSPINSPKVSELKSIDLNRGAEGDHRKNNSVRRGYNIQEVHEMGHQQEMNFNGNNDCTDDQLKKRGLRLVPMSMLVNYFG